MATEPNYVMAVGMVQVTNQGEILNVLHIRRFDSTSAPTAGQIQSFSNAFKETIRSRQHTSVTWDHWEAVQVAGPGTTYNPSTCRLEGGIAFVGSFTGTLTGGIGTSEPLPNKDAMVLTLRTGFRGRSRRGRVYYAGLVENAQNDGAWTGTEVGIVGPLVDTWLAAYKSGGTDTALNLVVFSRVIASGCKADPTQRHHPLVHVQDGDQSTSWKAVTEGVLRATVFSQRSRTRGRGA